MAQVVDDVLLDPIEGILDSVGLMEGELAPIKRFVVGGAIGAGIVFGAKPSLAFTADGQLRPWSVLSDDANATPVPWWFMVGLPAVVLGVFI